MKADKKVELIMQPNLRSTIMDLEIGQYFEVDKKHINTLNQYASMLSMGGKYYRVSRTGDIVRVTRIEKEDK